MANKRMFSRAVIDSDLFLDMPVSTQLLYFHLGMRADDDGFVNRPKSIARAVGTAEDDLKILVAKRFIIPFESGVIVIRHWRAHNHIPNDRYTPTDYKKEFECLTVENNKAYSLISGASLGDVSALNTTCIQPVNTLDTIDIDKDIDIDININNTICPSPSDEQADNEGKNSRSPAINSQTIANLYNKICISLPKVKSVNDSRKRAIKLIYPFIEENGGFKLFFERVEKSDFLSGRSGTWSGCGFDWIIKRANAVKIIEGNYDNRRPQTESSDALGYSNPLRYENTSMEV